MTIVYVINQSTSQPVNYSTRSVICEDPCKSVS